MPRISQLTDMVFDEVSLVDKGANQYARTVLSKRADDQEENVDPEIYDEDGVLVDLNDLEVGTVIETEDGEEFVVEEAEMDEEIGKAAPVRITATGRMARNGELVRRAAPGAVGGGASPRATRLNTLRRRVGDHLASVGSHTPGAGGSADKIRESGRVASDGFKQQMRARAKVGDVAGAADAANKRRGVQQRVTAGIRHNQQVRGGAVYAGGAAAATAGGVAYANRDKNVSKAFSASEIREQLSKAMSDDERDGIMSEALGQIEHLSDIAKAAEAAAHEERELRLEAEYVEVAKSYAVGVEPEVLGPVLKRCAESLSQEDQEVLAHALSVGTEAIEKFFDEAGTYGGGSNSDVLNSVDAYLDENIAKSDEDRNSAIVKMFEKNPDLYTEYDAERQHAIRYGY